MFKKPLTINQLEEIAECYKEIKKLNNRIADINENYKLGIDKDLRMSLESISKRIDKYLRAPSTG